MRKLTLVLTILSLMGCYSHELTTVSRLMCGHIKYFLKDDLGNDSYKYEIYIQEEESGGLSKYASNTTSLRERITNQVFVGDDSRVKCAAIDFLGEEKVTEVVNKDIPRLSGKYWTREIMCVRPVKIVRESNDRCI
jgi:hypothetical protein